MQKPNIIIRIGEKKKKAKESFCAQWIYSISTDLQTRVQYLRYVVDFLSVKKREGLRVFWVFLLPKQKK